MCILDTVERAGIRNKTNDQQLSSLLTRFNPALPWTSLHTMYIHETTISTIESPSALDVEHMTCA